ncbi:hypothetical protein FHT05_002601 [Xanthomonas arboricola]|uniref:DUF262 domain-containing protein n=1 Tax=Xanthomonas arboricola TaxID=56448 RepID=UPI0017AC434A|nr:DUF262 domain-containing protein [Xanthomonas arboricola]MBB6257996.1 hypothetical protein [Xanthomonas arboricola]
MDAAKIAKKFEKAQSSLVLQASDLSLQTITQMVASNAIDVSPRYQRRDRWKEAAQSQLIESFLINVPVPPVYLAEDDFGTYSVIDGKQRITAIHRFLTGGFKLDGLTNFPELNGLAFADLPAQLRNALSIRPYLRVVTLLRQTDQELKYEVFTRLNTSGEPLLPQEIRNAVYRGNFNELLFNLSRSQFLREQMKIKNETETPYKEMQDVESVLRFLSLRTQWQAFDGDMRRSLDQYASDNRELSIADLSKEEQAFRVAIARCEALWGANAFRRTEGSVYRDQFMSALYDAQMIAASELSEAKFKAIKGKQAQLEAATRALLKDPKYIDSIRVSTNSPSRVVLRVQKTKDMLARLV